MWSASGGEASAGFRLVWMEKKNEVMCYLTAWHQKPQFELYLFLQIKGPDVIEELKWTWNV